MKFSAGVRPFIFMSFHLKCAAIHYDESVSPPVHLKLRNLHCRFRETLQLIVRNCLEHAFKNVGFSINLKVDIP